jgi:hypothetical protein
MPSGAPVFGLRALAFATVVDMRSRHPAFDVLEHHRELTPAMIWFRCSSTMYNARNQRPAARFPLLLSRWPAPTAAHAVSDFRFVSHSRTSRSLMLGAMLPVESIAFSITTPEGGKP